MNVARDIVYGLNKKNIKATLFYLRSKDNYGLISSFATLFSVLRKSKDIEVLHSHGIFPDLFCFFLSFFFNFKWISTIHADPEEDLKFIYPKTYKIVCCFWRLILKKAKKAVYLTEYIYSKQKSQNKLFIHNSRLIEDLKINSLPNKCGLKRLGFCGALIERKNIKNLVLNFPNNSNYSLIVSGDGPLKSELKSIYKKNITYIGHNDDLSYFWSSIDILILPSFAEGVPLVAIEAIARGIPLILMNLDNYNGVFTDNEAFFISNINQDSLIFAIEHIYNNYEDYHLGAISAYAHNFNFANWIEKYIVLYSE
ncbi:TPA: glycosyltransferase family 4 protein [Providencia alcalifaciens]